MGKLEGIIQFTGTVGDLSFYKTQDGFIVRRKYGPSAERIRSDPAYAPTRQNNAEFAHAGKATRLMRLAFGPLLHWMVDNRVSGRLTRGLLKVIQSDTHNPRGERNVMNGDGTALEGFEFNVHSTLSRNLRVQPTGCIDSASGSASIFIEAFNPFTTVSAPEGATHFRLISAAAVIDFKESSYHTTPSATDALPLESSLLPALRLDHALPPESSGHVFLAVGIEFLQMVNGKLYQFYDGRTNAMAIVKSGWKTRQKLNDLGRDSDQVPAVKMKNFSIVFPALVAGVPETALSGNNPT